MSFFGSVLGVAIPQTNTQKKYSEEERVAFEHIINEYRDTGYFKTLSYARDSLKELEPQNCRNCGSAHTRIKNGVTICSYCGSKSSI